VKVLILTATVGEGHNAAARAVSEEIRNLDLSAEIRIENGLAYVGSFWERFVVDGYKFQLSKAQWSYSWLYWSIVKSQKVTHFYKGLCSVIGARKIHRLIQASAPDLVLSTYPLISAMLASLKRRGKVSLPCANLVTDFAPHPMWMYPELDDNYVMHISTIEMVSTMMEPSPTTVVAPLVSQRFLGPSRRAEARETLGIPSDAFVVMVIGGGWGVGNIERSARSVGTVDGVWTLVVCGRNAELQKRLSEDPPPNSIILGFVDNMPDLIDACDLAVQNAGGLTSLEALRRGCPLVITDAIPGHGVANGELMDRVGVARYVRNPADLPAAVAAAREDPSLRARAEGLAVGFGSLPSAGDALVELYKGSRRWAAVGLAETSANGSPGTHPEALSPRARLRRRRLRVSAAVAALVAVFAAITSGASVSFAGSHLGLRVVRRAGTTSVPSAVLCIRAASPFALGDVAGILASHGARASFFLPSELVENDPDLVATLGSVGEIQNGGTEQAVSRLSTPSHVHTQLAQSGEEIRIATGRAPTYYLPARGPFNPAAYLAAASARQRGVVGSVWIHSTRGTARDFNPGEVVVLDLTHRRGERAGAVLAAFLDRAAARGLKIVDLSSAHAGSDAEP
jgi:UDP-N-acetylglucosamine:LPS N-acetylglucosamine transferase